MLHTKVTIRDAMISWPALAVGFGHQAALMVLRDAGHRGDDPELAKALGAKTTGPLKRLLLACGNEDGRLAECALRQPPRVDPTWRQMSLRQQREAEEPTPRTDALVALGSRSLAGYQQSAFGMWDACENAELMMRLLVRGDPKVAVAVALKCARAAVSYKQPPGFMVSEIVDTLASWLRGEITDAQLSYATGVISERHRPYIERGEPNDRRAAFACMLMASSRKEPWYMAVYSAEMLSTTALAIAVENGSKGGTAAQARDITLAMRDLADVVRATVACPELVP